MFERMARWILISAFILPTAAFAGTFGLQEQKPAEQVVIDATKEIGDLEKATETLASGDKTAGQRLLKRLDLAKRKLTSARDQTHPDWESARKRANELGQKIADIANGKTPSLGEKKDAPPVPGKGPAPVPGQKNDAAKVAALDADVRKMNDDLGRVRVETLGDPAVVDGWRRRIADMKKRHGEFEKGDRKVESIGADIEAIEKVIERGIDDFSKRKSSTGISERLTEIVDGWKADKLPKALSLPLIPEEVKRWADTVRWALEKKHPADMAAIEELAAKPEADKQRIESARHWVGVQAKKEFEDIAAEGRQVIDGALLDADRYADFVLKIDPSDKDQVVNTLLGQGRFDETKSRLVAAERSVAAAVAFEAGLGKKGDTDLSALKQKIAKALKHVEKSAETALAEIRMPPSRSSEKKLLDIAAEVMKDRKHGIKGWKRMVVSYDVQKKERREAFVSPGTVTTTISVYHYVWEEYAVATAEKVGADWYVFINKLKYFSSGDPTTILDKWILSERFQSSRILEENIDK